MIFTTTCSAEMEIMDHPLFSVSFANDHARPLSHSDGFECTISISNFLPMVFDRPSSD